MKVAIVNYSDSGGGAAIAGWNLHQGLLSISVDSRLIVDTRTKSEAEGVYLLQRDHTFVDKVSNKLSHHLGLTGLSTMHSFGLLEHPQIKDADVVNLHLIGDKHFNYLAVAKLAKHKKVVMTLHDMWHFTGHCVYSFDCRRWVIGCGQCPYLDIYPSIQRDGTAWELKLKRWSFVRDNVSIVAISTWIKDMLSQSSLKSIPVAQIPNGIDLADYYAVDHKASKMNLGISEGKIALLFIAADMTDQRKGGDMLIQALNQLPDEIRENIVLLIVGAPDKVMLSQLNCAYKTFGFIGSESEKRKIYSAADYTVVPSRIDNLPLVIQESIACGTPVIANDVGGIKDLIQNGVTGFISNDISASSLMDTLLFASVNYDYKMRERCAQYAIEYWSMELQGERYRKYFLQLVSDYKMP